MGVSSTYCDGHWDILSNCNTSGRSESSCHIAAAEETAKLAAKLTVKRVIERAANKQTAEPRLEGTAAKQAAAEMVATVSSKLSALGAAHAGEPRRKPPLILVEKKDRST